MFGLPGMRDDVRYGFAVGRVRVLAGRLLSRVTLERLLDAPDLREQKRILAETHIGRYLEGAETAADVERGLTSSLADLYDDFLEQAGLPVAVVSFFRIPHDFANLRSVVKARILGVEVGTHDPLGSLPAEAFSGDGTELPEPMRAVLAMAEGGDGLPGLDDVETAVDGAMFASLTAAARASRVRLLRDLARLRVDIANARVLVRARGKGLRPAEVSARLVPGGSKALGTLALEASAMSAPDLAAALAGTGAFGRLHEADLMDVERFDGAAEMLVTERMLTARLAPGGAEPVLAYVLAREGEAMLLRAAVMGRLAGMDRESVRSRLKERIA